MTTKLHIPAPCHEKWSQMTPVRPDCRHCAACDRQIVDFSRKTDAELLEYLRQHSGKICGRFSTTQLDRPLISQRTAKRGSLTAIAASLAAVLAAQQPQGKETVEPLPVEHLPVAQYSSTTETPSTDTLRTISGKVVDETGESMIGATVIFAETKFKTYVDLEGNFALKVPIDTLKNNPLEIRIFHPGYLNITIRLTERILLEDLSLLPTQTILQESLMFTTGVLVYYPVDADIDGRPTLKSRVRRFFHKLSH